MIRRAFLAFALLACQRAPEKIAPSEIFDAAPAPTASLSASPSASIAPRPPAPFRAIPSGQWSSEDRGRVQLRIAGTRATISEHLEHERAPLTAGGAYKSTMEPDGSFNVVVSVTTLEKKFLSRCLRDCKEKDVWERFDRATLDGQEIAKGGTVELRVTFSEDDRLAEMCFTASKKCERLKRG